MASGYSAVLTHVSSSSYLKEAIIMDTGYKILTSFALKLSLSSKISPLGLETLSFSLWSLLLYYSLRGQEMPLYELAEDVTLKTHRSQPNQCKSHRSPSAGYYLEALYSVVVPAAMLPTFLSLVKVPWLLTQDFFRRLVHPELPSSVGFHRMEREQAEVNDSILSNFYEGSGGE